MLDFYSSIQLQMASTLAILCRILPSNIFSSDEFENDSLLLDYGDFQDIDPILSKNCEDFNESIESNEDIEDIFKASQKDFFSNNKLKFIVLKGRFTSFIYIELLSVARHSTVLRLNCDVFHTLFSLFSFMKSEYLEHERGPGYKDVLVARNYFSFYYDFAISVLQVFGEDYFSLYSSFLLDFLNELRSISEKYPRVITKDDKNVIGVFPFVEMIICFGLLKYSTDKDIRMALDLAFRIFFENFEIIDRQLVGQKHDSILQNWALILRDVVSSFRIFLLEVYFLPSISTQPHSFLKMALITSLWSDCINDSENFNDFYTYVSALSCIFISRGDLGDYILCLIDLWCKFISIAPVDLINVIRCILKFILDFLSYVASTYFGIELRHFSSGLVLNHSLIKSFFENLDFKFDSCLVGSCTYIEVYFLSFLSLLEAL